VIDAAAGPRPIGNPDQDNNMRKHLLIASVGLLLLAGLAFFAVPGRTKRGPDQERTKRGVDQKKRARGFTLTAAEAQQRMMKIQVIDRGPGILAITASKNLDPLSGDRRVWWRMEVYQMPSHTSIYNNEYVDSAVNVLANNPSRHTFAEQLELFPGKYDVWLEIREDALHIPDHTGKIMDKFLGKEGMLVSADIR
jgi:hypothetical protein